MSWISYLVISEPLISLSRQKDAAKDQKNYLDDQIITEATSKCCNVSLLKKFPYKSWFSRCSVPVLSSKISTSFITNCCRDENLRNSTYPQTVLCCWQGMLPVKYACFNKHTFCISQTSCRSQDCNKDGAESGHPRFGDIIGSKTVVTVSVCPIWKK